MSHNLPQNLTTPLNHKHEGSGQEDGRVPLQPGRVLRLQHRSGSGKHAVDGDGARVDVAGGGALPAAEAASHLGLQGEPEGPMDG